jgi:Icc-related predicted phosphoesterase
VLGWECLKLLAVSDLHFGLTQFDWLVQQTDKYDVVVIAGDLLDIAGHLDLDAQILIVAKYLRLISAKKPLLVCSGNHDGDSKNANDEYVARWLQRVRATGLTVDGTSCKLGDVHFSSCPWWDGPETRGAMHRFLAEERQRASGPWVWVHHAPPHGTPLSWTGKTHAGDPFVVDAIHEFKPDLVICGHIHNSPFSHGGSWVTRVGNTWAFNAGKQLGAPPSFISIDFGTQRALWSSQAGIEELHLNDPTAVPIVLA